MGLRTALTPPLSIMRSEARLVRMRKFPIKDIKLENGVQMEARVTDFPITMASRSKPIPLRLLILEASWCSDCDDITVTAFCNSC